MRSLCLITNYFGSAIFGQAFLFYMSVSSKRYNYNDNYTITLSVTSKNWITEGTKLNTDMLVTSQFISVEVDSITRL